MVLMILVIVVLFYSYIVLWLMVHPVMFVLYHLCTTHKVGCQFVVFWLVLSLDCEMTL